MAIIKNRSFSASKTSMEFKIVETDSVSSTINIHFYCGNHHLDYTFFVLRIFRSRSMGFNGFFLFVVYLGNKSELIEEQIYQFQCWINAGEYMSSRSTRSGIGITIYQDRKTIEKFALQIKHELN